MKVSDANLEPNRIASWLGFPVMDMDMDKDMDRQLLAFCWACWNEINKAIG